jgi:hypothetical protein
MRYFLAVAALLFAAGSPALADNGLTTYHITYGTHDLGTWNSMRMGTERGEYTPTTFMAFTNGPGFKSLSFNRPYADPNDQKVLAGAQPPDVALTVDIVRGGQTVRVLTCKTSRLYSYGTQGDVGKGTESAQFGCLAIAAASPSP